MPYPETNLHIVKTGFYDSKFVYKKLAQSPDREVEYYELEYFPESGGVSYINGQSYAIKQGNVLVAAPGYIRHSILHFKAYYVHFSTDNPALKSILNCMPHISEFGPDSPKIERIFKLIIQHFHDSDPIHMLYAESKLLELLFRLSTQNVAGVPQKNYPPIILRAMEYIDRNYKEDINLEDISDAVGLSPVYLHKLFLKATGQTPHQLLLKKRLTMAKELLASSDMSLVNVAAECGFSSQSYFNAVFKKHFGITPLTFRKNAFQEYQL